MNSGGLYASLLVRRAATLAACRGQGKALGRAEFSAASTVLRRGQAAQIWSGVGTQTHGASLSEARKPGGEKARGVPDWD